ncbi:hypothetical protein FRC08_012157 [Ceratobasidium sp. 394]|nr:hypothetical protein FRC08_012157 [Ceratobasidium sp. 394]
MAGQPVSSLHRTCHLIYHLHFRHYSLQVVQHPLRARMCGFGDKDRRPLAPAAVAKMVVRRQDDSFVDADDIDIAFFLVTVDLWSETGTEEMNLVLHPSSGGHATNSYPSRRIKRPPTTAYNIPPPATPYDSQPSTSNTHAPPPPPHPHQRPYPPGPPPPQWGYGGQNQGYIDPSLQQPPHPHPHPHHPPPVPAPGPAYPEEGGYPSGAAGSSYYVQTPAALHGAAVAAQHDVGPATVGGQYTRTLVGPLSANASRLVDAEDQPGIFFLFQDLSVRTEGTFRLRMRLMNVGAHPAPNAHATHVTTTSAPVLAQTFTQPFTVYSAKRFPGVPETTPLSVAFGTQGQKLPLRNRNPGASSKKRGRKGRGGGSDSEGDSEGGDSDDSQGSN